MKYVYRGMSEPDEERCKLLLAWHAAVRLFVNHLTERN